MRLHGRLFQDPEGAEPLRLYAMDLDDQNRMKAVDLSIKGGVVSVRDAVLPAEPDDSPTAGPDQAPDPIPDTRQRPLDPDDFTRPGQA